jgi:tRNA-dihydrouridine synthase
VQNIAKRGRYGAFLLEEQDLVLEIVRTLSAGLKVPLTVKIRILPDQPRSATVEYAQKIVRAGASVLTIHGRTRHEKAHLVGAPDWATIASVVSAVGIPVIANGGIATKSDVVQCLANTGAAAVMTSEMALCNPYLFGAVPSAGTSAGAATVKDVCNVTQSMAHLQCPTFLEQQSSLSSSLQHLPRLDALHTVVERYLDLVDQVGPLFYAPNKAVKSHLFKLLYHGLMEHEDLRDRLFAAQDLVEMRKVARALAATGWEAKVHGLEGGWLKTSWYYRHRTASTVAPLVQPDTSSVEEELRNESSKATAQPASAPEAEAGIEADEKASNCDQQAHLPQQKTTTVDSRNRKRDKRKVEQKLGLTEFPTTALPHSAGLSSIENNDGSTSSLPAAPAMKLYDLEGTWLADGYERVVYGDHGPYVELGPQHVQVFEGYHYG